MLGFRELQWEGSLVDIVDNVAVLVAMGVALTGSRIVLAAPHSHPRL